ncbi:uncharacterized protein LOC134479104 isoform X2 [Rattus norvegicus]|uniref:uncharacterized protein LOC134479104 isoform X2 n=1 Tax=Rattus norvegicus TaxID=10116 RepID=UPI002FD85CEC
MKVTQPIAFLQRGGLGPPTSKEKNAVKFVPYAPCALRLSWTLKMTSSNPTICCRGSQETKKLSDLSEGASLFEGCRLSGISEDRNARQKTNSPFFSRAQSTFASFFRSRSQPSCKVDLRGEMGRKIPGQGKLGGKLCYCSSPEENEGRTGQQEGLLVTLSIPGPEQTSWLTVQSLQNTELTDSMNKAENKPNGRGERNTQETSCVRMCKSVFAPSLCPPRGVPVRSWVSNQSGVDMPC